MEHARYRRWCAEVTDALEQELEWLLVIGVFVTCSTSGTRGLQGLRNCEFHLTVWGCVEIPLSSSAHAYVNYALKINSVVLERRG